MLRKLMIVLGLAIFGLAFAPGISGATSTNHPGDLPNGYHLKTDICHNVDHNPVVVHVSVDSTKVSQETGHGLLSLNVTTHGFVSFVPHVGTGGHEHDFILSVYIQHGNDKVYTYVNERKCEAEVTTTTTQPPVTTTTTSPPVTTTTQPPVTTTTQPPVVTTTTAPPVVTTTTEAPVTTTTQAPIVVPTTVAPPAPPAATPAVVAPVTPTPLARTGFDSGWLARIGLAAFGAGLVAMAYGRKNAGVRA